LRLPRIFALSRIEVARKQELEAPKPSFLPPIGFLYAKNGTKLKDLCNQ
jgi:hypothetical protein